MAKSQDTDEMKDTFKFKKAIWHSNRAEFVKTMAKNEESYWKKTLRNYLTTRCQIEEDPLVSMDIQDKVRFISKRNYKIYG